MSASPRPPPPPDLPHSNGAPSPPANSSPAQLATLLAKALADAESLKADLDTARRRADKFERLLATFQSSAAQSPTNGSPPSASLPQPANPPQLSDAARKAIIDCENRADRAEQARDEAEARLRMLQESWSELDRFFATAELRSADVRSQFSRLVADGGGPIVPVASLPAHTTAYSLQQPIQLPPLPPSRPLPSIRPSHRLSIPSQPFPPVALPPPPSASTSRVRPRAGSMDAGYAPALAGPGAPPPAKRPRNDRDSDERSRARRYSLSPSNSPHPAYLNGHAPDHSPSLPLHTSSPVAPHHYHPYQQTSSRARDGYTYPDQHRSRRRARSTSRGHSSRSRSRSRASSMSLEEMLIEATTTPGDGIDPHHSRAPHPAAQHLHPSSRHRSPSPGRDYHLAVPSHHSRSRATSSVQLHPSAHVASQAASSPGPLPAPGQVQTYQTHIFAPPVTGAPVKKSKLGAAGSALTGNGSVLTLGPTGSVISGPSAIGGGFPATNAQGQRICRQCGHPGRYKEGKCVEKWGPGPEGPGTVCDRCRKKMKRVERRGTLDGQTMAAQIHHQPAAIHPSGAPQAAPGSLTNGHVGSSQGSDRAIHRSDTLQVHSSQSQSRTLGPGGTHLLSGSQQSAYGRHDRERDHPSSPYHPPSFYDSHRSSQRGPTPPGIATLPGSGMHDDEAPYDDRTPRNAHKPSMNGHASGSSRSTSHSPATHTKGAVSVHPTTSRRASPRGSDGKSKSSELMDVDADGEEVDADADADVDADAEADEGEGDADADADPEADADAELLEAVDAAEANNATDEEWLKKEDA